MKELPLDGAWRFQPDPYDEGERLGYAAATGEILSRWGEVTVPAVFDRCGPGLAGYEGAAWFCRVFSVPEAWRDRYVVLRCGAVNYRARVWLNGIDAGANEDGFLPFDLPASGALHYGNENTVVVRADNMRRPGDVPGTKRGWRPYGGILRSVSLVARDRLHLASVRVEAAPEGNGTGSFRLIARIGNRHERTMAAAVTVRVEDGDGVERAVFVATVNAVPAGGEETVIVGGGITDVAPWSPEQPALYRARVMLRGEDDSVRDAREIPFGFRRVAAHAGRLELNDKPLRLLGFNRHEDGARADACADPETARQDLHRMKQMGANFVRLCHYPHEPATLDLCDQIGLLVMGEIPLYWWDGDTPGEEASAATLAAARRQLGRLIDRDACHPSVIFWSVSNETREERDEVARGNAELVRLAKQLDPTRLAVHVSDRWTRHPFFEADDVLCVNGYPSWMGRARNADGEYHLSESGRWWAENLRSLHEQFPDKPVLVTEFGYPAVEGVVEGAVGEETQARAIAAEWEGMTAPYVCGATLWCWADHPWPEENFIRYLTRSPFGVVTRERRSKAALAAVGRLFARGWRVPSLFLRRPNLDDLPEMPPLPEGCALRTRRRDDERDLDLEGLAGLLGAAFPDMDWTPERAHEAFVADATVEATFVIERDGIHLATASARRDEATYPGSGYVHWVAVHPEHRGLRLGHAVSLTTLHEFARVGCRDAVLETDDFRLAAIKTYLRLGFAPEFRHPSHPERWANVQAALAEGGDPS